MWWLIPFALLLIALFCGLNANYPMLGHDYFYLFPRLLEGKWHFLRQGLVPQRFVAHLCGGFVAYGNPNDFFYSLPQLLSFVMGLWPAMLISMGISLTLGYWGWYRVGRDVLNVPESWAHLLGLILLSSGFLYMHLLVGHFSFLTLPLVSWLLWLLFDRRPDDGRRLLARGCLFALTCAIMLAAAGYLMLLIAALAALFLLLFLLLGSSSPGGQLRSFGLRAGVFGLLALALSASKLTATYSLMRFFVRATPFDPFPPSMSVPRFLLHAFWALPQRASLFPQPAFPWEMHEYSMFLSPVVAIGLIAAVVVLWQGRRKISRGRWSLVGVAVLLTLLFFAELTRGEGILADPLAHLPVFSSLRVTVRFLYSLQILLTMAAVWGLSRWAQSSRFADRGNVIALAAAAITIIAFVLAYRPLWPNRDLDISLPYDRLEEEMTSHPGFLREPISMVEDVLHVSDFEPLFSGSTGVGCYEPLFAHTSYGKPLVIGPVGTVQNGGVNIYNPACYQYPEENHCQPGDRIAVDDRENFEHFLRGEATTWAVSKAQRLSDALSGLSLLGILGFLVWYAWRERRRLAR